MCRLQVLGELWLHVKVKLLIKSISLIYIMNSCWICLNLKQFPPLTPPSCSSSSSSSSLHWLIQPVEVSMLLCVMSDHVCQLSIPKDTRFVCAARDGEEEHSCGWLSWQESFVLYTAAICIHWLKMFKLLSAEGNCEGQNTALCDLSLFNSQRTGATNEPWCLMCFQCTSGIYTSKTVGQFNSNPALFFHISGWKKNE